MRGDGGRGKGLIGPETCAELDFAKTSEDLDHWSCISHRKMEMIPLGARCVETSIMGQYVGSSCSKSCDGMPSRTIVASPAHKMTRNRNLRVY